jgi:hypothetical protein
MELETTKLKDSGMPADFVMRKNGTWNHLDWLEFLARVRIAGHTMLSDHEVGQVLEEEKAKFLAARAATAGRPGTNTSIASQRRAFRELVARVFVALRAFGHAVVAFTGRSAVHRHTYQ